MRCRSCNGSKRILGGGFVYQDCPNCNGTGKIVDQELNDIDHNEIADLVHKQIKRKREKTHA